MLTLFLKDNMELFDYNVQERVNDFVAAALSQVSWACLSSDFLKMLFDFWDLRTWLETKNWVEWLRGVGSFEGNSPWRLNEPNSHKGLT